MPIDLVYNLGVRHLFSAPPLPPTPRPPRQFFSYALSATLLAGSAVSMYYGLSALGLIFLGGMVVVGGCNPHHFAVVSWFVVLQADFR